MAVKPVGDNVAVRFVELSEEDIKEARRLWEVPGSDAPTEPVLALIVGVGTEVTRKGFKKGDTVLLKPWAINATALTAGVYAIDSWSVMAVVTE